MTVTTTLVRFSFMIAVVISLVDLAACHKQKCQLWHYYYKESCKCCSGINQVIKCNTKYLLTPNSHCLTWNQAENYVELARCLFTGQNTKASNHECYQYRISTDITGLDLNNFTCKPYNREGSQCRKCIDGYGP